MDEGDLYRRIKRVLIDQFDVDESVISLDANLYEELEIDSIDAVDLLIQLKEWTGKRIPPEVFRDIRTIRDVMGAVADL
jgi:acyl carrier protein